MRRLAEPHVLKSAILASLASAVLCAPRLALWTKRPYPVWYAEAVLFFCGIVLWAMVFAWHAEYSGRPVFTVKWKWPLFGTATLVGVIVAVAWYFLVDPALRQKTPEEYPTTMPQWIAMALFSLACSQLVLLFAPYAWSVRLVRNRTAAMALTVVLGVVVLALKARSSATPYPALLLVQLTAFRLLGGWFAVWLYLRGG